MGYINNSYFKSGEWNAICDVCGFKHKSGDIKLRWDGLRVCPKDWEMDHPQKYIRVRETGQAVPFIRDDTPPVFIPVCYIYGIGAYADLGEADCMQADKASPSYQFLLDLKNASSDQ